MSHPLRANVFKYIHQRKWLDSFSQFIFDLSAIFLTKAVFVLASCTFASLVDPTQSKLFTGGWNSDDKGHYQSYERLENKLIKHSKLFSMVTYPKPLHDIREGNNTSLHIRRTMLKFWKEKWNTCCATYEIPIF